jgi:hypothetical protein
MSKRIVKALGFKMEAPDKPHGQPLTVGWFKMGGGKAKGKAKSAKVSKQATKSK